MDEIIKKWQHIFRLKDWKITTNKIPSESIIYNGEDYFIGIHRDFSRKLAVIYHDINLTEEAIIHELLHIVFPLPNEDETFEDYERWITDVTENLANED